MTCAVRMTSAKKTWKNTVFWEIWDILWKCFGFHWLAKMAEIIKTCGKNQCFGRSLTTYGRALKSQVGRSHQKKQKKRRKLWKNMCFLPCCSVPVIYLFLYLYIYLQSPAVILSSDLPQPIDLLSANLFICVYIYIYACIYFYIYIFTCNHLQSF